MNNCAGHETRVVAAYMAMMGHTQQEIGQTVHRTARTVYNWTKEPCWPTHRTETVDRWMKDVINASRKAILDQLRSGDGNLGLKILERVEPALSPAPQRVDVGVSVEAQSSARDRLKIAIGRTASRIEASNGKHKA